MIDLQPNVVLHVYVGEDKWVMKMVWKLDLIKLVLYQNCQIHYPLPHLESV